MVVSTGENKLTPKVMLPGCAIKPADGGEYQSFNIYSKDRIRELLLNYETDISSKIRCLFFGRFHGDEESSEILIESLNYSDSVLYRHEVLYVLGQMGLKSPLNCLYNILGNLDEHPMVRHEAGEAIAAIGDLKSMQVIEKYINDDSPAVRETCYLARHSLRTKSKKREELNNTSDYGLLNRRGVGDNPDNISDFNAFNTRDPTPPNNSCETSQVEFLISDLLNSEMHLEKRYGALFALRNILTGVINSNQKSNLLDSQVKYKNESEIVNNIANKIAEAMEHDDKSAVFRHECAFVLGQIQVISTADSLSRVISNTNEESMVRHEAAFALGSVGSTDPRFCTSDNDHLFNHDKTDAARVRKLAIETLTKFSNDSDIIVAESCIVGLQTIIDETGTLEIEI
ncbi:protein with 4xEZ_heat domains [Cryptosporidium ryanae]|uniref:protein with 4xEZ_heat domains n=1 Tax=Cryptosporidium ryanae TaxID=515981 RepID=UPI00351A520F|nr:protein with 4xEZ_heat domains [Cryptosporidium ryanae]